MPEYASIRDRSRSKSNEGCRVKVEKIRSLAYICGIFVETGRDLSSVFYMIVGG